jgi:hypothetical protein
MPQVGFEPTIPAFERAKIFHVFDLATIVIGANLRCSETILATRHILDDGYM